MSEFFKEFICEQNGSYSVIIEDDGRVCYAYLIEKGNISSDVWLYNCIKSNNAMTWRNQNEMPFLNLDEFINKINNISPLTDKDTIDIVWYFVKNKLSHADLIINGKLVGRLELGIKPGYSVTALRDGPLAKRLLI